MKFESIDYVLGSQKLSVNDLSPAIDISVLEKIKNKSGIESIRICNESEDAVILAQKLLEKSENIKKILASDLIIVVSESKKLPIPPISSHILYKLGILENKIVLDIDSGCAGYVQALQIVDSFFQNRLIKNGVIITTDAYSKYIEKDDRSVSPIFGDGASITFLKNDNHTSIKSFHNGSDMEKFNYLQTKSNAGYKLKMIGSEVFMFVKKNISSSVRKCLSQDSLNIEEIDYFFFHQASKLVLDELRKDLDISEKKSPFSIKETGNLVSTSIPFLLHSFINELRDKKIILSGFGVGLSWATILMDLK
jgi:3-oxoacyl-[acyl-carrier-protein] synthase III